MYKYTHLPTLPYMENGLITPAPIIASSFVNFDEGTFEPTFSFLLNIDKRKERI